MAQFFWFDGRAPQGPFEIAELLKKPGFGPESIVCPVGAQTPEDWKPAASYEPLREAFAPPSQPQNTPVEPSAPQEPPKGPFENVVSPVGTQKAEDRKPEASYEPLREAFAPPSAPQNTPVEPSAPQEPPKRLGFLIAAVVIASLGAALFGLYLRHSSAPPPESPSINLAPPAPAKLPAQQGSPIQE